MRYFFIFSIFGILLMSRCSVPDSSNIQAPDTLSILPKDSFKLILKKIHLTDAYLSTLSADELKDSLKNAENIYGSLFKKYHLTNKIFQQTLLYYSYHLSSLDSIYTEILDELNREKDSLQYQVQSDE